MTNGPFSLVDLSARPVMYFLKSGSFTASSGLLNFFGNESEPSRGVNSFNPGSMKTTLPWM